MIGKKFILVSREMMGKVFKLNGVFKIKSGLPEDAKLVGLEYVSETDSYRLVYESETWEPTPECCPLLMFDFGYMERVGSL